MALAVLALAACAAACRTPQAAPASPLAPDQEPAAQEPPPAAVARSDPELETGLMFRPMERGWAARLRLPLTVTLTEFHLGSGVSLDDLATVSLVPTAEFIVPLDERWTLLPSVGLGGALQSGDDDLIGTDDALLLASGGVRAQRWQPLAGDSTFLFKTELRYDAVLTGRDGLLGDWGSFDAAVELRRALGDPRAAGFEPGVYVLGIWYWDPVELDIDGVSPRSVDDQVEVGLSFGSATPRRFLGMTLPRVYLGARFGDDLTALRIRFGRL